MDDIAAHLAFVAQKEGVTAEPEALHMIAEKAADLILDNTPLPPQKASFYTADSEASKP